MPDDLSRANPWHYDQKYDPGTSADLSRPLSIEQMLQTTSRSERGGPLSKEQLAEAQAFLLEKNMLNRNPGDQDVQETIRKYMQSKKARKVASKWLTLTDSL